MAVPKRKTSKSRRDQRSASKFIRPQIFSECSHCSAPLLPHIVCEGCGFYRGRKIIKTKLDRSLARREKGGGVQHASPEAHDASGSPTES